MWKGNNVVCWNDMGCKYKGRKACAFEQFSFAFKIPNCVITGKDYKGKRHRKLHFRLNGEKCVHW